MLGNINPEDYISERYNNTVNESDVLYTVNKDEKRMKEMVNLNMKWFMQTLLDSRDIKVNAI